MKPIKTKDRIMTLISDKEMSVKELARELSITHQSAGAAIKQMREAGKPICIRLWKQSHASPIPCYSIGSQPDAKRPPEARQLIQDCIRKQAMSVPEIAKATGVTAQTIARIMQSIDKCVPLRIDSWVIGRGRHTPRYIIGEGEDAPKPAPLTNAERIKKYRNTEKGKKTCRKCRVRWSKTLAGKEYIRKHGQAKYARTIFQKHGVKAIDPLLAIFYR